MSTIGHLSESTNAKNFLDSDFSQFTDRVRAAARNNTLRVEPFLRHADRANRIVRGLEVIFSIASANMRREDVFVLDGNQADVEPPLSGSSVEALLSLGAAGVDPVIPDTASH